MLRMMSAMESTSTAAAAADGGGGGERKELSYTRAVADMAKLVLVMVAASTRSRLVETTTAERWQHIVLLQALRARGSMCV